MKEEGTKVRKKPREKKFLHSSIHLGEMNHMRGAGVDNYVKGSREVKKYSSATREAVLAERTDPVEQERMPLGQRAKVVKSREGGRGSLLRNL